MSDGSHNLSEDLLQKVCFVVVLFDKLFKIVLYLSRLARIIIIKIK